MRSLAIGFVYRERVRSAELTPAGIIDRAHSVSPGPGHHRFAGADNVDWAPAAGAARGTLKGMHINKLR